MSESAVRVIEREADSVLNEWRRRESELAAKLLALTQAYDEAALAAHEELQHLVERLDGETPSGAERKAAVERLLARQDELRALMEERTKEWPMVRRLGPQQRSPERRAALLGGAPASTVGGSGAGSRLGGGGGGGGGAGAAGGSPGLLVLVGQETSPAGRRPRHYDKEKDKETVNEEKGRK